MPNKKTSDAIPQKTPIEYFKKIRDITIGYSNGEPKIWYRYSVNGTRILFDKKNCEIGGYQCEFYVGREGTNIQKLQIQLHTSITRILKSIGKKLSLYSVDESQIHKLLMEICNNGNLTNYNYFIVRKSASHATNDPDSYMIMKIIHRESNSEMLGPYYTVTVDTFFSPMNNVNRNSFLWLPKY